MSAPGRTASGGDAGSHARALVPRPLEVAAAWTWRLLLLAVGVVALVYVLGTVQVVVLPIIGALLLTTFLHPLVRRLRRAGLAPALATTAVLLGAVVVAGGVLSGVGLLSRDEVDRIDLNVRQGAQDVEDWLVEGPLGVPRERIHSAADGLQRLAADPDGALTGNVITGAMVAAEVVAGAILALILLFFFLKDGERMWGWIVRRLGRDAGGHLDAAGRRAWRGLCGYMRGQAIVAAVDAVAIGIGIFLLGVPFAVPLALLTFFAAFFPIVGAVAAGSVAVLVALATEGVVTALMLLGVVVAVQQLEGNLLEPVVMGRTVRLHPVVILLALGAGAAVAGIVGAFLAVPVAAAVTAAMSYVWARIGPEDQRDERPPEERGHDRPARGGADGAGGRREGVLGAGPRDGAGG